MVVFSPLSTYTNSLIFMSHVVFYLLLLNLGSFMHFKVLPMPLLGLDGKTADWPTYNAYYVTGKTY